MSMFSHHWRAATLSWKWLILFLLALAVALTLPLIMTQLIKPDEVLLRGDQSVRMVEFVRLKREDPLLEKSRQLPEPKLEQPPPLRQPLLETRQQQTAMPTTIDLPALNIPLALDVGLGLGALFQGGGDGEVIPLVRVEPAYPQLALNRRLEGWVKVGLKVTPQGTVKDAKILEAEPAHVFDRAVLRAVTRWRFKPKIVNGEPVENYVTQVIQFKMDN